MEKWWKIGKKEEKIDVLNTETSIFLMFFYASADTKQPPTPNYVKNLHIKYIKNVTNLHINP